MNLFDDLDSFELKATKIHNQGLTPLCDHRDVNVGVFRCLGCMVPLFDRDSLINESSIIYSFKRPTSPERLHVWFEVESYLPRTCIDCINCGLHLGHMESSWRKEEKTFYVISKKVFLDLKLQA
jgi:peptide methionine sulfoxide reductase MsrB